MLDNVTVARNGTVLYVLTHDAAIIPMFVQYGPVHGFRTRRFGVPRVSQLGGMDVTKAT